ncbi:DUF2974 domain-containing protein, partial [Streptococcus ruminantium]
RQIILTCFRGTDDTIIGWKEDFHMAYMDEIPAQRAASAYLKKTHGMPIWKLLSGRTFKRWKSSTLRSLSTPF